MKIILASSSIYRQKLLQQLHINFSCESPDIDESIKEQESACELVQRLAYEKACTIAQHHIHTPGFIIGCDQVATLNDKILGKPHTHDNAVKQLLACNGKSVTFLTGLSLFNCKTMQATTVYDSFKVTFRSLSKNQIEFYLQTEKPYDCAGSFKMEGFGISLFEKLEGDDPNSLIGLPLIKLNQLLFDAGFDVLAP